MTKRIAVVTGASSGMGREFALQLVRGMELDELWAIARSEDKLAALTAEIGETTVRPLPLDLSRRESVEQYAALLAAEQPEIAVLVCAAGYGKFLPLLDTAPDDICGMLDLNAKALTLMTVASAPYMPRGGRIYELGSGSSFQPVPYMTVYGASKAYVLNLSRALNAELRPRGIGVTAVCPGWVSTDFFRRAVEDESAVTYYDRFYTAEQVVRQALRDGAKGKDLSVCGFPVRLRNLMVKLLPTRLVMNVWLKQQGHR